MPKPSGNVAVNYNGLARSAPDAGVLGILGQMQGNAPVALTEEEKKRLWLERIHASPYYRPRDPDASMIESNLNMMRQNIYPYLLQAGLAVRNYGPPMPEYGPPQPNFLSRLLGY